jgi:hypothetical protein
VVTLVDHESFFHTKFAVWTLWFAHAGACDGEARFVRAPRGLRTTAGKYASVAEGARVSPTHVLDDTRGPASSRIACVIGSTNELSLSDVVSMVRMFSTDCCPSWSLVCPSVPYIPARAPRA